MAKPTQEKLQRDILEATAINIVTCPENGCVFLYEMDTPELKAGGMLTCAHCGYEDNQYQFPDLNY